MPLIYPDCKECGAKHWFGVEEMATGIITPLDICPNCLFSFTILPEEETSVEIKNE